MGSPEKGMSFEDSMEECRYLIELCIKNQFNKAIDICDKWCQTSLYHSHGKSLLMFMKAVLTLETPEIAQALDANNETNNMCQKYRRSVSLANSVSKYLWKHNYNAYSEEEIHAELIHAENLLLISMLTFFSDQNIMSLIKGAFRLRACHSSYKFCLDISENRTEWKSERSKVHFRSGVMLGNGAINLVFSHLPKRVLKLLEIIGFSGDRRVGLDLLNRCATDSAGLRYFPAQLVIAGYECYINQMFGVSKSNLEVVEQFVDKGLANCDTSSWFLWFRARILQLRGDIDGAVDHYNSCIEAQDDIKQMHNICFWELLWCHAVKFQWDQAANYAQILKEQCNWSAATFTYQKATFLYMKMLDENKPELHSQVSELFREVPKLKVRIAGKTIPPEKFVCVNAVKYFDQKESLILPAFELMYIWNVFTILDQNPTIVDKMVERINRLIPKYINDRDSMNAIENYLLLLLLKGICLKCKKQHKEAEKCFAEIFRNEKHIKKDKFILPMASLELGLTKLDLDNKSEAKRWLKKAKNDFSGYLLEIVVHFKAHSALQRIRQLTKDEELDAINSNDNNSTNNSNNSNNRK
ncbi:tetratricopeptide repeat protein 39A-like isoform X2 [Oppia nitens]|nr:tetratricopeptide repeat protein 39A-like isoform X2 [Oppia nitens]XP_054165710.1 tetratricopeptide repeat protein 39A-like isoform X2 [Oppia nitens]